MKNDINQKTEIIVLDTNKFNINRPILFKYQFDKHGSQSLQYTKLKPVQFKFIEVIALNFCKDESNNIDDAYFLDLMFVYNDPLKRNEGFLILGYFNDGCI